MDKSNLKNKILNIQSKFKKEVFDDYLEFPISSGERKLIERLSEIFLFKELKLDIQNKKFDELAKEAKLFVERLGRGSAFLTRLMMVYINQELQNSSFSMDDLQRKTDEYKNKINRVQSNAVIIGSPEEFLKWFFHDPKKSSRSDVEYYKNLYQYYYYYVLTKFMDFTRL